MRKKKKVKEHCLREIKRMYDVNMKLTKRINSHKNPSSMGLTCEQVKNLSKYIIEVLEGKHRGGSYRYLIYYILEGVAYCDGMVDMGLLDLNNALAPACLRKCKRRKYYK